MFIANIGHYFAFEALIKEQVSSHSKQVQSVYSLCRFTVAIHMFITEEKSSRRTWFENYQVSWRPWFSSPARARYCTWISGLAETNRAMHCFWRWPCVHIKGLYGWHITSAKVDIVFLSGRSQVRHQNGIIKWQWECFVNVGTGARIDLQTQQHRHWHNHTRS